MPGASDSHDNFLAVRGTEFSLHEFINGVSFLENTQPQFSPGVSPQILETVGLMTGGFTPEYGNRFGGVLDITTRSGADLGRHGDIDFRGATVDNYVLHTLLAANQEVLLFDVRQPLDLLARYEIIPGAKRIPPKEVLENPSLIPKEKDSIVYCTCPSDKTSRAILHRALAMHFLRIKFLKGGLAAWKAKGYPVEPYNVPFHL